MAAAEEGVDMLEQDKRETKATTLAMGESPPERTREDLLCVEVEWTRIEQTFSFTRLLREVDDKCAPGL